ncbi:hypothetical protein [Comamonas terrigena]|uniref:hypothetical protein n=1 Tax=Comamonas terrigena TaxID=32013 RepID=UPI002353B30A|nr:hypothetical protein [Comamonas terrigena]
MSSPTFTRKQQAERLDIALTASYEMEAISRHLNGNLPMEQPEYQHLRALVVRVLSLNSVVMSVLGGDDGRETEEMRNVVEGCA